jgi:hypothetical protein
MCPDTLGLVDAGSEVRLIDGGRLLIDNGRAARLFDRGFCLEYFSDRSGKKLALSAFLCKSVKPNATLPSRSPTSEPPGTKIK